MRAREFGIRWRACAKEILVETEQKYRSLLKMTDIVGILIDGIFFMLHFCTNNSILECLFVYDIPFK